MKGSLAERAGALGPLAVASAKALAMALCFLAGFRAVSDDDYARVAIAQAQAVSPRLDPTGTSWLPAPFWLGGAFMALFGRELEVARLLAALLGILSALVVYAAARRIATSRAGAVLGATLAAVFPWSARLGIATVPELPTAALCLYAASTLAPPRGGGGEAGRARLVGALGLFFATLSRYEAWPLAAGFAVICAKDALFPLSSRPATRSGGSAPRNVELGLAALVALAGPALWVVHNRIAHGSALRFLERVAAYKRALDQEAPPLWARLLAYPEAMVRHEPELFAALAVLAGLFLALGLGRRGGGERARAELRLALLPYARPALLVGFQLACLAAAMVRDGAPTHHPERAVLVLLLLAAIGVGDLGLFAARRAPRSQAIVAALVLAASVALSAGIVRRWYRREDFAARQAEEAMGRAARELLSPGRRALLEVRDYGFYATVAASGRPEDLVPDRDFGPGPGISPSSFDSPGRLAARLAETGAEALIARRDAPALRLLSPERAEGELGFYRVSVPFSGGPAP